MASILDGPSNKPNNDTAIKNATTRLNAAGKSGSLLDQSYADTGNQSFKDQLLSKLSPLMNLTDSTLNVVERPSQSILHALQSLHQDAQGKALHGFAEYGEPAAYVDAAKAAVRGFKDVKGEDNLNLRSTLNQDPNVGGRWLGLVDTIGTSAMDPLTYVTAGTGGVAKVGLKVISEKVGKDVADAVAKGGIKSLSEADQAAARQALADHAAQSGANKFEQNAGRQLEDGKGVKFAGKTVLPYENLRPGAEAAHIPQALDAIKNTKTAQILSEAVQPFARVKTQLGTKGAAAVQRVITRGRAAADNAANDVTTQTRAAIKDSGLNQSQLEKLAPALASGDTAGLDDASKSLVQKVRALMDEAKSGTENLHAKDISNTERQLTFLGEAPDVISKGKAGVARVGEEVQQKFDLGATKNIPEHSTQKPNLKAVFDKAFPGAGRRGTDKVIHAATNEHVGDEMAQRLGVGQDVHLRAPTYITKGAQPEIPGVLNEFKGKALGQSELFGKGDNLRVLTRDAVKAINNNQTQIAKALQLDVHASPAAIVKHLLEALPNSNLQEADARLAPLLDLKHVFKTNPVEAATDISVRAHRDAATAETLKGLAGVKDEFGNPALFVAKEGPEGHAAEEAARKLGYTKANTVLGTVYAPQALLKELDHAAITLTDDHALKALSGMVDQWAKLWRGYATVPALFGLGFHERNLAGNVFNMWLGGFRNVGLFRTTDKIGRAIESGINHASKINPGGKGLSADEAINQAKSLSPAERHWVRLAREEGVIGDSFFRTDQATTPSFKSQSVKEKLAKNLNPVDTNNAILKSGTYIGRRIEDNSRLAMFIDQMQKHGDPQTAAEAVKKALFDYSELTPTEKAIKKVIPFYTYTRKNTPLQIQALLQNPGKFSDLAHLRDNAVEGASDNNGQPIPQYALQQGAIPLTGGDHPIVASLNTPFQAAMSQLQPLGELASQLPGGPASTEGGSGKAAREILQNFGGGPLDAAKFGIEQATGKSLLTGSDLKPGTSQDRAAKALLPLFGKGESTIKDVTSGDPDQQRARALSAALGLSTTTLSDKAVGGEKARRAKVLQGAAKGSTTLSQLRKTGKAPKATKSHKKASGKITAAKLPSKKAGSTLPKKPKAP